MRHRGLILGLALAASAGRLSAAPVATSSCPTFRWVTLGTAGGPIPTARRSEPANLLIAGDQNMLVDAGDGTVDQLARYGLDLSKIDAVFISHHHLDHTAGLAGVIGLRWMVNPKVLTIYGPPGTAELVAGLIASMEPQARVGYGIGVLPVPPAQTVRVIEMKGGESVTFGDVTVRAVANTHFDAAPSGTLPAQSLSYRFTYGGRSITYTGDTGPSQAVTDLAHGSDMLVSEVIDLSGIIAAMHATRPDLQPQLFADMEKHLSTHHLMPQDVGRMAKDAAVGHLVMTHIAAPPDGRSDDKIRSGASSVFNGPVDLASDLAIFETGCAAAPSIDRKP